MAPPHHFLLPSHPIHALPLSFNPYPLSRYELTFPNAILAEEKHLPLYTEIQAAPFVPEYVAGGSCQNTVRVAQWMNNEANSTYFAGVIGNDDNGKQLTKVASADGVNVKYTTSDSLRTGLCAVFIKDFDRSMCTDLQAASSFKLENLEDSKEHWSTASHIVVEGYFLTICEDAIVKLAKQQAEAGKVFAFSLSAPFICQFFTAGVKKVLAYANVIFGTETEAELLSEAMGWDLGKDHVKIVAKIGEYPFAEGITGTRKVVITRADDVVVANGSEVALFGVEKLPKEEMVDANGAGDAFCGGFIAAMMKAKGDDIAVKAGVYAAQVIIRTSGTKLPTDAPKFAF